MMGTLTLLLIAALGVALLVLWWRQEGKLPAWLQQEGWLPAELRQGEMVGVEKSLMATTPFLVTGRPDRVYRLASGAHTPLDFKNRDTTRLFESDRAQLSLQAWLLRRNSKPTAPHGYLVVRLRKTGKTSALKVDLGDDAYCERLIRRYLALREGSVKPVKAKDARCNTCGHKGDC
jgi:CRISPR-associated exonuclease Cas4